MSSEENIKNQGFKVNDRRRFTPEGAPNSQEEAAANPDLAQSSEERPVNPLPSESSEETLSANFSSLILSIAAGAQSALGISTHPLTGKIEKNLSQAQYSIDLLGVLSEKTQGNLKAEEANLLQALLYDLRLRFLEAKNEGNGN